MSLPPYVMTKLWRRGLLDSIVAQAMAALVLVIFGAAVWAMVLWNLGRADSQRWHETVRQQISMYQEDGDTDELIRRLGELGVEATYEPSYNDAFGLQGDGGERARAKLWVRLPTSTPTWAAFEPRRKRVSIWAWAAGMAVLAGALSWMMAWQWVRPLRRLAASADDIVRGKAPAQISSPLELAQLGQALELAANSARTAAEERKLFLAGVSHDLRQPLARVRMAMELSPIQDEELAEGIERDLEEMDQLLGQFIEWVRDGQDEVRVDLDLGEMISELVQSSCVPWEVKLPAGKAMIQAPPLALRRALGNIVHNAQRHGQGPFEIEVQQQGQGWLVSVRDHGRSSPPQDYQSLFEPFRGMGPRAGAGLGLAVAYRVISHMGGQVLLDSTTEAGGWTVQVILPK